MFHARKFQAKVPMNTYKWDCHFWNAWILWACGGHPVTTQDTSCINSSIAKEQFKGKLTVVPTKNPNDHEMLKIIIQVLQATQQSLTCVHPFSGMGEDLFTVEKFSEPQQN